jgi:hypothetical protein
MNDKPRLARWLLVVSIAAGSLAWGQDDHRHDRARLDVALDGKRLSIELDAPAQNVLGFEYEPFTMPERQASEQATRWLQAGQGLFELPAEANCQLAASVLQPPDWAKRRQEQRENSELAREVFQDENVPTAETAPHADYRARYRFDCENPDKLEWVDARLVERLKGGVRLQANVMTEGAQRQQVLSKDSTRIALR